MHRVLYFTLVLSLTACDPTGAAKPPPTGRLYFPAGLVHVDDASNPEGHLYVANSNQDRRYDQGYLTALDLSRFTSLPAFGALPFPTEPVSELELGLEPGEVALLNTFAGQMAGYALPGGGTRLFIPTRAEGSYLDVVDANPASDRTLKCFTGDEADCTQGALSLASVLDDGAVKPRADAPFGVSVSPDGAVYVTHIQHADDPIGSRTALSSYLVRLDANAPAIDLGSSFISLGQGVANSVAIGSRYAFLAGRIDQGAFTPTPLLRAVDRQNAARILDPGLNASGSGSISAAEARGLVLTPDESRLYLVTTNPSLLVTVNLSNPTSDFIGMRAVRADELPAGADQIVRIPRAGRGGLLVISCTQSDVVLVYDEDAARVVAEVPGVGDRPYGLAVDDRGTGARIYVSVFGDGRIAVIDLPDYAHPEDVGLVGFIGRRQRCLVNETGRACEEE
jgi:DNA-binding beta-propeller fold protein YncE